MAISGPSYEVTCQLSEDVSDEALDEAPAGLRSGLAEHLGSLARFAGLLAGSEIAAITRWRGDGLIVELTDPPTPWLTPGAFMRAQSPDGDEDDWRAEPLLKGRMRWCWCQPPPGLYSAALISGPALFSSRRLLLVANLGSRLNEVNLGLAASYLAQTRRPAPGAPVGDDRPVPGECARSARRISEDGFREGVPGGLTRSTPGTAQTPPPPGEAGS
jgi:hypothetical protein